MIKMTKEEFWLELIQKYPVQMADFLQWVDEYKRRECWIWLFDERIDEGDGYGRGRVREIKFHHIPNAMQLGIFIQYTVEHGGRPFTDENLLSNELSMEEWVNRIRTWFEDEQTLETRALNNQLRKD